MADELRRCGCEIRVDAAGNLHARPEGLSWDSPAWLSGSHLDTVPNGGDFDGVAGVVVPLEILRAAKRDDLPLELVVFAEEEGTTFGRGMLGSHAWVGNLSAGDLSELFNDAGENYLEAGIPHGVEPGLIGSDRLRTETVRGFIEIHIEQGPALWKRGESTAVVTAIAGRRQLRARIEGRANHAGSTAMADRQDALVCAAEIVLALESMAKKLSKQTVITVGQITCIPNAVNVVPGEVTFTIDFRSPDDSVLETGTRRVEEIVRETASSRRVSAALEHTEALRAQKMDSELCDQLKAAAARLRPRPLTEAVSGALHDAAILAPHVPAAMLFIASRDGISHNPDEFSRIEDLAAAAEILQELVSR